MLTRSMSKQLKRTRSEIEDNQSDNDAEYLPPKIEDEAEPPRKKRKLNRNTAEEKEPSLDITDENDANSNNKLKTSKTDSKAEINRLKCKHRELLDLGYKCIVGVDEAGRGPLAGPVVISAAYVPINIYIEGITDSKKINNENEREKLFQIITSTKEIKYSITILDHTVIDEYNILESSMMGFRQCVQKLHDQLKNEGENGVDYALCDGNRDPLFEYPASLSYEYIIKGDGSIYCIGAASIIAKVTRDRIMIEYDKKYPHYKLKQNKGYPTPEHKQLVWQHGPCDIHRKSFRPVKDWYKKHKPEIHKKMALLKKQRADERKKKIKKQKDGKKKKKSGKIEKGQTSISKFFGAKKKKKNKIVEKNNEEEEEEQKELESESE